MMMMKFMWLIDILILIQIALRCFKSYASLNAKTESEKLLFAKPLQEMTVKWQLLQILAQDLRK